MKKTDKRTMKKNYDKSIFKTFELKKNWFLRGRPTGFRNL